MYSKGLLAVQPKYGTPEHSLWLAQCRKEIESQVGQVWDTSELQDDFNIESFGGPGFCFGTRRSDNAKISLAFTHSPRFYYGLTVDATDSIIVLKR